MKQNPSTSRPRPPRRRAPQPGRVRGVNPFTRGPGIPPRTPGRLRGGKRPLTDRPGEGAQYLRPLPWRCIRGEPRPSGRRSPPPAGGGGHCLPSLVTGRGCIKRPSGAAGGGGGAAPARSPGAAPGAAHRPAPVPAPSPGQLSPAEEPRPAAAPDTAPGANVVSAPGRWKPSLVSEESRGAGGAERPASASPPATKARPPPRPRV